MTDLLIVGRGPSIHGHRFDLSMPVMAVSSGVFAIPPDMPCEHFVTLDPLKFFMRALSFGDLAWGSDEQVDHRPFWRDETMTKHVLSLRLAPGKFRELPPEVWTAIPARHMAAFQAELGKGLHNFGFQPSWGDCPNVRGWDVFTARPPNFGDNGRADLGLDGVVNSWLMAVQVAPLLGYTRLHFIGCDFRHDCYGRILETIRRWQDLYRDRGVEWVNLSPASRLADFVPTLEGVAS